VQSLSTRIDRLRNSNSKSTIVDISPAYFPYIQTILEQHQDVDVIIISAEDEEIRDAFNLWFKSQPLAYNYWISEESNGWFVQPDFGRQYPNLNVADRNLAIEVFVELCRRFAHDAVVRNTRRVFAIKVNDLQSIQGATDILSFVGVSQAHQLLDPSMLLSRPTPQPYPLNASSANSRCVVIVPHLGGITTQTEEGLKKLEERGYVVWRRGGVSAIDQGRSLFASEALLAGFTEIMWIDSDIKFSADSIDVLRSHAQPVVSAIYPKKGIRALASNVLPGTPDLRFGPEGGLVEIDYAAAGFLLVRREVLIKMIAELKLPATNELFGGCVIYPFFLPMVIPFKDSQWYLGEDFAFSHRAKECGFKIYADTSIRLWHIGSYEYGWEDAGREVQRFTNYRYKLS
jgi:hypothetical protein